MADPTNPAQTHPPAHPSALGAHWLMDLDHCDAGTLADAQRIEAALVAAVRGSGGTIVTQVFHQFSPHGVSGVVVIAESHLAIHTWPEHGYAAVDAFSCSPSFDLERCGLLLQEALGASSNTVTRFERGARPENAQARSSRRRIAG